METGGWGGGGGELTMIATNLLHCGGTGGESESTMSAALLWRLGENRTYMQVFLRHEAAQQEKPVCLTASDVAGKGPLVEGALARGCHHIVLLGSARSRGEEEACLSCQQEV